MKGIVRYSQPESVQPSFVIIQAVYDTYDTMPVKPEATNTADLSSQPDVRFVFIGQYKHPRLKEKTNSYHLVIFYFTNLSFLTFCRSPFGARSPEKHLAATSSSGLNVAAGADVL